ncbi:EF-hand domain-containing protein [Ottowia sp.]|uniref:EF-hand domain-containing protein n=1 Tax=Ottowia sp. TaxID=1898956 RepID=UPI0025DDEECB|nr:EF-hand domain-containing protein [Ottowia sp.]MBK6616072.1 EF-hand domain-containing protein [Ottowia sp.]
MPATPKLPDPATFAAEQLRAFDTDRNSKVTWAEFSARLRKAFNDMDRKQRGYLTKEDFQAAYEKALAAVPSRPSSE